ncbi:hypothetical protein PsYK624_147420 [Phanerochaete sordida]|uniref:Uncharacterized protein n=1 Tax=Phanerochaete sordida TaxID=48140 RepID=A0A9P3GN60_9APHY|nr:hypothetical protein PsYK624_147420 [Phanerochaete sordida]
MSSYRSFVLSALAILPACLATVCSPGEIAIGKVATKAYGSVGGQITIEQGFMMDNSCQVFAQASSNNAVPLAAIFGGGSTICGPYNGKAAVQCDGAGNPATATDTNGNTWSCHATTDTGCNSQNYNVVACCDVTAHASRRRGFRFARQA